MHPSSTLGSAHHRAARRDDGSTAPCPGSRLQSTKGSCARWRLASDHRTGKLASASLQSAAGTRSDSASGSRSNRKRPGDQQAQHSPRHPNGQEDAACWPRVIGSARRMTTADPRFGLLWAWSLPASTVGALPTSPGEAPGRARRRYPSAAQARHRYMRTRLQRCRRPIRHDPGDVRTPRSHGWSPERIVRRA